MTQTVTPDLFEVYRVAILAGWVPLDGVPAFMRDNPDFAVWYAAQRMRRLLGAVRVEAIA